MVARSASSARSALSTFAALAAAVAAAAAFAVACSAPADAKKPLPVCDANDSTCSGGRSPSTSNQTHSDVPTDPVPAPDQATDDPASTSPSAPTSKPSSPEAGVDAAPVVGQFCQELATCCNDLGAAGYDTSMCKSVLSTNNEDACYAKHDSYKQSGDCT
jgi:hypothetical protein